MWADNETGIDLLGFDFLVDSLVVALSESRLLPLTVGVLGDWGSGKSSLMGLACAALSQVGVSKEGDTSRGEDNRYVCVRFSPWQYEDYDDVKVSLMLAVLTRLAAEAAKDGEQQETISGLKAFVRSFRRRIRRVARGGVGLLPATVPAVAGMVDPSLDPAWVAVGQGAMQAAATSMAERLEEPVPASAPDDASISDVAEFRDRFADLVKSLDHVAAVVVFIDDLDRCLPETVVDTFEAIRLLLGTERTAFVVAANQKIVESAVDARYPELRGSDHAGGIGAQYLEKMLQLKIAVPALAVPEAVTYVNLLLAQLHLSEHEFGRVCSHVAAQRATHTLEVAFNLGTLGELGVDVPPDLVTDLEWAAAIGPVLAAGSRGNPRQIKLFLNTLQLRRRSAQRREVSLDPAVLAKLMLLESQHFEDFQQLFDWQVASGGPTCPQLAAAEQMELAGDATESSETTGQPAERAGDDTRAPRPKSAPRRSRADAAVQGWVKRESVKAWLRLRPRLAAVDLRPYFTYSRDRLSLDTVSAARLSGLQQRLLGQLLGATDAVRRAGLDGLVKAEPSNQGPVIEALAKAILTSTQDAFVAVCETVERVERSREVLFRALEWLPIAAVPLEHVAVAGRRLPADDPRTVALLEKWASGGREDLAKMVAIVQRGPKRGRR